jgi:hypothetical protein
MRRYEEKDHDAEETPDDHHQEAKNDGQKGRHGPQESHYYP